MCCRQHSTRDPTMYLAMEKVAGRLHYYIRQSFRNRRTGILESRQLFDLGDEPGNHILYGGGNSFYIDPAVARHISSLIEVVDEAALENLLYPFVRWDIRLTVDHFQRRQSRRTTSGRSSVRAEDIRSLHNFDKRRLHFLRCGSINQMSLHKRPALFKPLLDKSRDELEQYFLVLEDKLERSELRLYTYVAFNLQRFFSEKTALLMPQALDRQKMEEMFLQELCKLHEDRRFWSGMPGSDSLQPYLRRYAVMFFDFGFGPGFFRDDVRDFMDSHRQPRNPPQHSVDLIEAGRLFGFPSEELQSMNRRALRQLYRSMAKKLHPDTGGGHEKFVRLSEAYEFLLAGRK